jgi:hypothetical protein
VKRRTVSKCHEPENAGTVKLAGNLQPYRF